MAHLASKSELDVAIEKLEEKLEQMERALRELENQREAVTEKLYQLYAAKNVMAEIGIYAANEETKKETSEESRTEPPRRIRTRRNVNVASHTRSGVDDRKQTLAGVIMDYFNSPEICAKAGEVYRDLETKPEVRSQNSINTTLSRLAKSGKLVSTKDGYRLPKGEEPDAATPGSSGASSNTAVRAGAGAGGANQQGR